mgnify:CR=1 FL=1
MPNVNPGILFEIFNEIGIIEQLSRARLEARLPEGLIAPHFTVLNRLVRVQDGATPLEMARAFQVPKTSLTHTLQGLEKHDLVEMRPNPADGRSKTVWITDKGRALREATIQSLAPEFIQLMQTFDVEALLAVKPTLTALRKLLDENR